MILILDRFSVSLVSRTAESLVIGQAVGVIKALINNNSRFHFIFLFLDSMHLQVLPIIIFHTLALSWSNLAGDVWRTVLSASVKSA